MEQGNYQVIVTGSVLEGFEQAQVLAAAAKLFKCSEQQASRLLQGKATTLKREMEAATAERYVERLAKFGIASRLQPVTPAELVLELSADAQPAVAPESGTQSSSPALSEKDAVAGSALSLHPVSTSKDASAEPATGGETGFRCPKCGASQEKGKECINCGIIFSRYQEAAATEAVTGKSADEGYDLDELDELALFIGENREKYRYKFAQLYQNKGQYQAQWHWPAFLAPLPWLIYRKLYWWAAGFLVMQIILPPVAWLALGISMGIMGNYLYYRHATQRIRNISSVGEERRDEIIESGGVNSLLVTIGSTFLAGVLMMVVFYLFFLPPAAEEVMTRHAEARKEIEQVGDSKTKQKMLMLKNLLGIKKAASGLMKKKFDMPQDIDEIRKMLGAPPKSTEDEWGNQMDVEVDGKTITFYSAGEDGRFDTDDDVTFQTELR